MPSSPPSRADWRAQLRGAAIALHVAAVLLLALPSIGGLMSRSAWQEPSVQQEFATWADTLGAIGIQRTPEALQADLWSIATAYVGLHKTVLAPIAPYARWMGTGQAWMMFPAPELRPAVLEIDVQVDGIWTPVYRARSPVHEWRRGFFDQDRIRTLMFHYTWPHIRRRGLFTDLQRWLGPWLAQDFPEASHARLRFRRYSTPSPADARAGITPKSLYEAENQLDLADYR